MSDQGKKGPARPAASVPEVETFGKGVPEPWYRTVTRSAANLRRIYGPIDRHTGERMARTFRATIVPRKAPGRRPSTEVITAVEMLLQNKPWPQIYPEAINGYSDMPFHLRSYRSYNLRRASAAYMKRRGIKRPIRSPHKSS